MSTEQIDIVALDKIEPSISTKLQTIATNADNSASALERLQQQLNSVNVGGLVVLQAQMASLAEASVTVAATFAGFNQVIAPTLTTIDRLSTAYAQLTQTSKQAAQAQLTLGSAMQLAGGATGATVPTGSATSVRALANASTALSEATVNLGAASELLSQAWIALDAVGVTLGATFALVATEGARLAVVLAEAGLASELQARAVGVDTTAMQALAREVAALGVAVNSAVSQLATLTAAVETVGTRVRATSNSFLNFNNVITGMMALQAIKWVVDLIDAYTSLSNRMAVIATGNVTAAQSLQSLFSIANDTRTSVESLAKVYQQTGIAAKELGATQREMNVFTKAVAEAIAIQGGSAEASRGALIQLSQALGTGKVRAEEFNSMLEGSYTIVQYAARGIERMGGSVAKLRQEVITGKVSSTEFFNALVSQAGNIDEQFKHTAATITQSLDVMRNKMIEFVGTSHIASDVSQTFGLVMVGLAHSIDVLGRSVAALVVGGGLFGLAKVYNSVTTAIEAAIAANTLYNASFVATNEIALAASATLTATQAALRAEYLATANAMTTQTMAATAAEAVHARSIVTFNKTLDALLAGKATRLTLVGAVNQLNVAEAGAIRTREVLAASTANLTRLEAQLVATTAALNVQQELAASSQAAMAATTRWGVLVAKVKEYAAIVVTLGASNPWLAVAAALASTVGILYAFSDQLKISSDGVVTLHDGFIVAFRAIIGTLNLAYQGIQLFIEGLRSIDKAIPSARSQTIVNALGLQDAELNLYGFTRKAIDAFDVIAGSAVATGALIVGTFSNTGKSAGQNFIDGYNSVHVAKYLFGDIDAKLKDTSQKIKDETKYWQDWLKDNAMKVAAPKSMNAEELKKTVEVVSKFSEELDKQLGLLNTYGNARQTLQEIEKLDQKLGKYNLSISQAQREELTTYITKLNEYKQVSGIIDQLYNASQQKQARDYAANVKAINTALDRHIISATEALNAMNKLSDEYKLASASDVDKTLKSLNDELNQQQALVGQVGNELIAVAAIRAKEKESLTTGVNLNLQLKSRIADLAVETEHTRQLNAEVGKLYADTLIKKAADYALQQEAINTALARGVINANEAVAATNKLKESYDQLTLTPVGKIISDMNDALERQQALLGKVGPGLAKATALYDAQQKAKATGTTVTLDEAQRITDLAAATQLAVLAQDQFNEAFSKAKDPVERFNEKVSKAALLLHDGIINQEGYNRALRAFEKERDSSIEGKEAFNIEHINKKLQDQIEATKLLGDEKERMNKFDQIKESLDSKHITLTSAQTAKIKEQIATIVEQTHVQSIMDTVYKATDGVMKDYMRTQEAIDKMFAKSPQYVKQYTKALIDARMKVLEVDNTVKAGLEHGLLAQLKKVSDVTGTVSNYITTAFSTMENTFVDFLKTGKFAWADFAKSIIEQTMHMVTQLLIIKPILEAIKASISGSTSGAGNFISSLGSLVGFANGGEFVVGGSPATDSNIVAFRATAGEKVTVNTPAQQQSGNTPNNTQNVHVTINATDADSFFRSRNQVASTISRAVNRSRRIQ